MALVPISQGIPNSALGLFVQKHYAPAGQKAAFLKFKKSGFVPPATPAAAPAPAAAPSPAADPTLAGLGEGQVGHINAFDAFTARQTPRIQGAYDALATALNTNADQTSARLGSLGSLIQSSPSVGGAPPGTPGGTAALAEAARQSFGAKAAVTVGQESALPGMAKTTGQQYLDNFLNTRANARDALIGGYVTANASADQKQRETAAKLRGQDLQLLGTQLAQKGGLDKATIAALASQSNAGTAASSREAVAQTNASSRETVANIAAAARATVSGKNKKPAAGRPGSSQYASARTGYVKTIADDFFHTQAAPQRDAQGNVVKDPATGKIVKDPLGGTERVLYNSDTTPSILRGLALGLRPAHILAAIRSVNPDYGTHPTDVVEFEHALTSGGFPPRRATAIAKALLGSTAGSAAAGAASGLPAAVTF